MEYGVLQVLGLLATICVAALGVIKWLLSRIDTVGTSTAAHIATAKAERDAQVNALAVKLDVAMTAISDIRVSYASKPELTAVVQMFQSSMDRQSVETSRAIDGITSRIDNLINIVTRQFNGQS